jgi:3-oxoacyl-[acyl-carrier protein] reductase
MPEFEGKVALITGGGTGIGRATALLLARHGVNVAVNYSRSRDDAERTAADVQAAGASSISVKANVGDEAQVRAMVAETVDKLGRLDFLVNNAGTTHAAPLADLDAITDENWDDIFRVNVKGTFYASRAAIPEMRKNGGGHIVNVSSIAGINARGSSIPYSMSKAAIINLTKSLAIGQAPDIQVNAVAPGVVETRWIVGWEEFTSAHREHTPMKRLAQSEDVANTIYGLLLNDFITGHTVVIDGGRML